MRLVRSIARCISIFIESLWRTQMKIHSQQLPKRLELAKAYQWRVKRNHEIVITRDVSAFFHLENRADA